MTASSVMWVPAGDTGTKLYDCIKAASDLMTAVGLALHTSDTGQIDLTGSSITPPGTLSVSGAEIGYQVRKLVSPGKPTLYFRVSYWLIAGATNTSSTYRLNIFFSVGTGTDGAGTLSGPKFTTILNSHTTGGGPTSAQSMTTLRPLYMASDGENYFSLIHDPAFVGGGTTSYMTFTVGRTVNPLTGAYDSDGVVSYCVVTSQPNIAHQVLNLNSGVAYVSSAAPIQAGYIFTASGSLTEATVFPVTVLIPQAKGPAREFLGCYAADVTSGSQYAVPMYGANVNYMAAGAIESGKIAFMTPANARMLYIYQ